jgi:methionyl-tRNA synthetase
MEDKIGYDDFSKLDMRVGKIITVEDHPNADKLFVFKVDFGELGERTICAGLKKYYSAEELEGKKGIFIVNLEPRDLRGVESNGMILAVGSKEENLCVILEPEKDVKEGSKVS